MVNCNHGGVELGVGMCAIFTALRCAATPSFNCGLNTKLFVRIQEEWLLNIGQG